MNRYYELVKGIEPEKANGVTVEAGWEPEAGAEIVGGS